MVTQQGPQYMLRAIPVTLQGDTLHVQIEHDLDLPPFETSAEAEKHAANLMKVFR